MHKMPTARCALSVLDGRISMRSNTCVCKLTFKIKIFTLSVFVAFRFVT